MSLTNKQKKWIEKKRSKLSTDKMAKELNVTKEEVDDFLAAAKKPKEKKIFYLVLILIPILFFVFLEIGLRIFNYGYNFTQWVEVTDTKLMLNPDIAHKYFYITKEVPYSNQDVFDKTKKGNAFRIFVLGGSSGAGYPFLPLGSFSRYLKDRLSLVYPHSTIEVINCSMTAINSYSLRDFMPDIVKQKPDLILIYAGHNEYYGALGVGSMESIGASRNIVNLVISLEKFRTFQLVRNTIHWIKKLLSRKNTQPSGTLMARMAQNQYIQLNSDVYKKGIQQFEGNLKDILEIAKENNIPVILGTLACNLKDQYPFVSINSKNYPRADIIFKQATEELKHENISKADSLFRLAKDLDALRFRAPSEINRTIVSLANKFRNPIINIDSAFNAMSPYHIVGNNLMTDHLHPTLQGYKIIGKLFYKAMEENKLLPNSVPRNLSNEKQDSLTSVNFNFTSLDSTIGEYRIKLLKNDWPYIKKKNQVPVNKLLQPKDYIDSLAYNLMLNKIDWEPAHRSAANYYLLTKNYSKFIDMMNALISQYPFIIEYYNFAANKLLEAKIFDKAYFYLQGSFNIKPSDFSAKWLGIINLNKGNIESAKKFLLESIKLNSRDAQAWYNLAGCYVNKEDYKSALDAVNNSLKISPQYRDAKVLQAQLIQALKSK